MKNETDLVPHNEVRSKKIQLNLNLPEYLTSGVTVDLKSLEKAVQLAGFRSLKVIGTWDQGTSSVAFTPTDLNADGTSTRGVSTVDTATKGTIKWSGEGARPKQTAWPDLAVEINMNELQRILLESEDFDPKSAADWSEKITNRIHEALLQAGYRHLVKVDLFNGLVTVGYYILALISVSMFIETLFENAKIGVFPQVLLTVLFFGIGQLIFDSGVYGQEKKGAGRRVSLFYQLEVDRFLTLLIYSLRSDYFQAEQKDS